MTVLSGWNVAESPRSRWCLRQLDFVKEPTETSFCRSWRDARRLFSSVVESLPYRVRAGAKVASPRHCLTEQSMRVRELPGDAQPLGTVGQACPADDAGVAAFVQLRVQPTGTL